MTPVLRPLTGWQVLRAARTLVFLGLAVGGGTVALADTGPSTVPPPPDLSQMPAEPPARAAKPQPAASKTTTSPAKAAPQTGNSSTTTLPSEPGDPLIQRNVFEDEGSRIEETRVRGQVQRITVTPKVGGNKVSYEIMPGDGSGSESSRSTAGKRVWNVLQF